MKSDNPIHALALNGELTCEETRSMIEQGEAVLIDVREHAEYRSESIAGAISHPLSTFDLEILNEILGVKKPIFQCRTGIRSADALNRWLADGNDGFHLAGGIHNWIAEGMGGRASRTGTSIDVMRQTQMTAGLLILTLSVLSLLLNPIWSVGTTLVGMGLFHAGASGTCGLAMVISWLPWNRLRPCPDCG